MQFVVAGPVPDLVVEFVVRCDDCCSYEASRSWQYHVIGVYGRPCCGLDHDQGFAFHVTAKVLPAATVSVTNDDSTTHTVTADSGHGFDVTVDPGKTVAFTAPHAPGSYKFHCNFHADMHGTLTVK